MAVHRKKRMMNVNPDVSMYVNGTLVPDADLYRFAHAVIAVERAQFKLVRMASELNDPWYGK